MSKFDVNYASLEQKIFKKAFKLKDVQHQLVKYAFDLVKFPEMDDGANLWQIQKDHDGDYIVALYQSDDHKVASSWDVTVNKIAGNLQISYKGDPLVRISSAKLGIPVKELDKVEEYLPAKLADNKKLVKALLNELSPTSKSQVLNKYPELI